MIRLFVTERLETESCVPIMSSYWGSQCPRNALYVQSVFEDLVAQGPVFDVATQVENADYILVPHRLEDLAKRHPEYIESVVSLCKKNNKKAIIFDDGDFAWPYAPDSFIVLRVQQYKDLRQKNEIIIPPVAEDIGRFFSEPISHQRVLPRVGFCGWSKPSTRYSGIKLVIKNFIIDFTSVILMNSNLRAHKRGIFFRSVVLKKLRQDKRLVCNFIELSNFGAHKATIQADSATARRNYIDNIATSDFSLAIRGDGNFSIRFYEILSMGRIPVFLDTNCILPLENQIDYDQIMLRVPYQEIESLPDKIADFFSKADENFFSEMQKKARETFVRELYYPTFFKNLFSDAANIESLINQ